MDMPHWPQDLLVKPMEDQDHTPNSNSNSNSKTSNSSSFDRSRARPNKTVNCPRCDSTNTKFCYYNNYSLSQPRYFCKTCRRYWTEGGTLRNIPVGGGSRKNKRNSSSLSSSSSSHSSASKKLPDLQVVPSAPSVVLSQNPRIQSIHHDHYGQDLNLGFPSNHSFKTFSEFMQAPNFDATKHTNSPASNASTITSTVATSPAQFSAMELLTGITRGTSTSSFMPIPIPDPNSVYSPSGQLMIPMSEFKIPSLSFSLDGVAGGLHDGTNGRLLFPFEDLKTNATTTHDDPHHHVEQSRDQNGDSSGFWNGMLGGGSW